MTASKPSTSTDWSRADAYENTPADYAELPELDDAFFERAERSHAVEERPAALMTDPEETARIARLRDAIVEIWGRPAYDVTGVTRSPNGGLLLSLRAVVPDRKTTGADDD